MRRSVWVILFLSGIFLLAAVTNGFAQTTELVSVNSSGVPGEDDSLAPSISSDGRFVAFESDATNLVTSDTNGLRDVFVHDRQTGQTTRVSVSSSGVEATGGGSFHPSISSDGRFVAFESDATNLVTSDTNGLRDIFVHDRNTGETTRVSVSSSGVEATGGGSFHPSISSDGRFVAFESDATNLVTSDTNTRRDIFVRDRGATQTTRVSIDSGGVQGNSDSFAPSISSDGRFVAFESDATNLVLGDTNARRDIFVRDRGTAQTTRVSIDSGGVQGDFDSFAPSISSDGRFVAFESDATNLVAGDTNGLRDIFIHDRNTGDTTRVSIVDTSGAQATGGGSFNPSISSDGHLVAFESDATNLVTSDTNARRDIFVRNRQTGRTTRVNVSSGGAEAADGDSFNPSMSPDGRVVAFESDATNLVAGDTNGFRDIFVHDLSGSSVAEGTRPYKGCFIDTASDRIPRNVDGALLLLVAAAAFAAAIRLKTGS